ncbi:DUF3592 domain-containing protein [Streptomyces sp. VRA16 Mangrove soil]|uniref:DUF3592 domain-containing protein n=1 Tax=Streptomyces sp. VRA16 Mangrove soil TaxID=2817434 RepID=UPI001A9DB14C|nr:DUF3592 domain-containing protein [Streptomyces sp. VRA16 Mangrove soil]MBO1335400.1 hypothetical protein [Streptomyces sp. VRA16 Mangrove soil]
MIVLAAFTALGGLVALLAGAYGLRRTRRIRAAGNVVEALVKPPQPGSDRPLLQFATADGQVIEVVSPVPAGRHRPLPAGGVVSVAYDTEDPRETVVLGGERPGVDRGFMIAGAVLVLVGMGLAVALG